MQEAGGDAVLETAFTLADGLEYCRSGTSPIHAVNMSLLTHSQGSYRPWKVLESPEIKMKLKC